MTRKLRRTYCRSIVVAFITVLATVIALTALAQMPDGGRWSAKRNAVSAQPDPGTSWQGRRHRPLPGTDNVDSHSSSSWQRDWSRAREIPQEGSLFLPAVTYPSGGGMADAVVVVDLNRDGILDLAAANCCPDNVGVLLGNGDGTFRAAVTYQSSGGPISLAAGDLNGDESPDIVVANYWSSTIAVLLNNGDGTLQPEVDYPVGGPNWVVVADVNGDGKPDVVVAAGSSVGVLLGNGDGTFQSAVYYDPGGWSTYGVAVGDLNGDGKPDVVTANQCDWYCVSGAVGVLLGNGDGTFQPAVAYLSGGSGANAVAVADLNKDGKDDVVVVNCTPPNYGGCDATQGDGPAGVLLGNGDGTLQPAVSYDPGAPQSWGVAVADVNLDAKADVVIANFEGPVGVLLRNGDGSFQPVTTYSSGGSDTGLAIADLNGDRKPDVVVANYWEGTLGVLLNNAVALRRTKTVVTTSGSPSFVGQTVAFTATVTSRYGTIPDGELVTFYDGATAIDSVALVGGTAAYTTSTLSAKTHYIKAKYAGDAIFKPSVGRVQQIVLKYSTATTLTSNPNPSNYGQPVTFTATVTPSGPYPITGKVKFWDGTIGIGTATLNGGIATLRKSTLAVGTHPITAQYMSDSFNAKSTSPVVDQMVQ